MILNLINKQKFAKPTGFKHRQNIGLPLQVHNMLFPIDMDLKHRPRYWGGGGGV